MAVLGRGAVSHERGAPASARAPTFGFTALELLSLQMDLLISFRKSTPPQNRQLNISISNSERYVDDFVRELTV